MENKIETPEIKPTEEFCPRCIKVTEQTVKYGLGCTWLLCKVCGCEHDFVNTFYADEE